MALWTKGRWGLAAPAHAPLAKLRLHVDGDKKGQRDEERKCRRGVTNCNRTNRSDRGSSEWGWIHAWKWNGGAHEHQVRPRSQWTRSMPHHSSAESISLCLSPHDTRVQWCLGWWEWTPQNLHWVQERELQTRFNTPLTLQLFAASIQAKIWATICWERHRGGRALALAFWL
jgi:hypothetical protein